MENRHLYIVLTKPNTVISNLIQLIKNDTYTHAAIALDKELEHMYSFGRKHTYNPFIGSFRRENLNTGVYTFSKNLPGVIIEIEVSTQQHEKAKKLLEHFIRNSIHYKYNYMGLINSLINKEACCDDRFLCSEFVYYILKESDIADFKVSRNLVRPVNLLNLNGRMVYKGDLKEII